VIGVLTVFDRTLAGAAVGGSGVLTLSGDLGGAVRMDAANWCRRRLPGDAGLLERCAGPTLDVGCGPGRLTAALLRRGVPALGVDISATAVRLARRRGAIALRRDVFEHTPGQGRWRHLLLADGNIGIGGDPARLLARCGELIAEGGQVHVELQAPGVVGWAGEATLSSGDEAGTLRWAVVAVDDVAAPAARAELRVVETWTEAGRWFATLSR
jgi:SAM-dependent methyltransferase